MIYGQDNSDTVSMTSYPGGPAVPCAACSYDNPPEAQSCANCGVWIGPSTPQPSAAADIPAPSLVRISPVSSVVGMFVVGAILAKSVYIPMNWISDAPTFMGTSLVGTSAGIAVALWLLRPTGRLPAATAMVLIGLPAVLVSPIVKSAPGTQPSPTKKVRREVPRM